MQTAITILLWALTLLFCFMILVSLYNYQTLFGLHWFVIGFQISNAMAQFHLHDWPVLIAEILPAIFALIGTAIVLFNAQRRKAEVQYEFQR